MEDINQLWDTISHELGWHDHNMRRDRPYNGQPHTDTGIRGATEVKGVTFRDLRDCMVRAFFLSAGHVSSAHYNEACKGEDAALCENDLYGWDLNRLDPVAVIQNFTCEVERIMGIYPNVPKLRPTTQEQTGGEMTVPVVRRAQPRNRRSQAMIPDDVIVKAGTNMLAHTDMVPLEYVRQLEKDAERYRWLRKGAHDDIAVVRGLGAMDYGMSMVAYTYSDEIDGDDLDAAIDAAMSKEGK